MTEEELGKIARKAIEDAGGSTKVAKVLTKLSGRRVSRDQVQKWKERGVSPWWVPWVVRITNKTLEDLRPDMYGDIL